MRYSEGKNQKGRKAPSGRILDRDLFLYLLDLEVKRARRYQNFLCLLLLKLRQLSKTDDERYLQTCQRTLGNLLSREMRETDILGDWGNNKLVALLPYADTSAGGNAKSRIETTLKYYDFRSKGCEVTIDQIYFPMNGADTADLIKHSGNGMRTSPESNQKRK